MRILTLLLFNIIQIISFTRPEIDHKGSLLPHQIHLRISDPVARVLSRSDIEGVNKFRKRNSHFQIGLRNT